MMRMRYSVVNKYLNISFTDANCTSFLCIIVWIHLHGRVDDNLACNISVEVLLMRHYEFLSFITTVIVLFSMIIMMWACGKKYFIMFCKLRFDGKWESYYMIPSFAMQSDFSLSNLSSEWVNEWSNND